LPEGVIWSLKKALKISTRPEEKKLILGELPNFPCNESLSLAESLLSDEDVKEEAKIVVEQIKDKLNEKK
jgi:hypothetical protein